MASKSLLLLSLLSVAGLSVARDDGNARTPPMGWLSWLRYACEVDCKTYPDSCINERLYKAQADRLAADGFKDLGYEYVMIDDCWSEMKRDANRRLVPNKDRFPDGIKALADYVHSKGLKLGIYGDVGPKTCAGYPSQNGANGSNFFDIDAKTFAEWGIDSFKFDGCNQDPKTFDDLYPKMGAALNKSGRHILFSCEWPLYQYFHNPRINPNYEAIAKTCHIFRNFGDVADSWGSLNSIIDFYGSNNDLFMKHNGPGHFFDPDMLAIGDFGLSYEQSKTQMAMWAMWSAPLFMSNDLRNLKDEDKKLLLNKEVIAVNQDKLGKMAKFHGKRNERQVWVKELSSTNKGPAYAVVYVDSNGIGDKYYMSNKVSDLIPNAKNGTEFAVYDLFRDEGKDLLTKVKPTDQLSLRVATGGGCRMVKLVPQ